MRSIFLAILMFAASTAFAQSMNVIDVYPGNYASEDGQYRYTINADLKISFSNFKVTILDPVQASRPNILTQTPSFDALPTIETDTDGSEIIVYRSEIEWGCFNNGVGKR